MNDYVDSPVLHKISHGDYCETIDPDTVPYDWIICGDTLREIFDVPSGATQIQFRGHKEPGPNRNPMNFRYLESQSFTWFDGDIDGWHEDLLDCLTSDAIRKLVKRRLNWYVECYYWE